MALVLSLREGDSFMAGASSFRVSRIIDPLNFELTGGDGAVTVVNEDREIEICPEVFVSAGDKAKSSMVRVTISAPKEIGISRL